MKINGLFLFSFILFFSHGCKSPADCLKLLMNIENEITAGNLEKAVSDAIYLKKKCSEDSLLIIKADSLVQIAERISMDFSLTEEQVTTRLQKYPGKYSQEERAEWEKNSWLEWRMINGEKKYFNRAVSNLFLIKNFILERKNRDSAIATDKNIIFRKEHTESILKVSRRDGEPVLPVDLKIDYILTIKPGSVPPGEIVRCWLPYPKENNPRQKNIIFISASHPDYIISPDSAIHRTIYMEARSEKNIPLVFKVSYSYQTSGQYFNLKKVNIKPYNTISSIYRTYTAEQPPQICFTEKIKHLADSITGAESNPAEIVKSIYYWFNKNIPWAGAMEYSIMPNIPEYVLMNKKGDCGMQTFLLMSMLRYKGIPIKWQSGWMVPPDDKNLHDWCEVYYEGAGWVPVDVSYELQYSANLNTREFYISGIDSYRLIVNDGISGTLYPEKRFLRSEPFDFQRGEAEWRGGNLYFDKWDYSMNIEYKKEK
jgi:hypothetical protein